MTRHQFRPTLLASPILLMMQHPVSLPSDVLNLVDLSDVNRAPVRMNDPIFAPIYPDLHRYTDIKQHVIRKYGDRAAALFFEPTSWDWRWPAFTVFRVSGQLADDRMQPAVSEARCFTVSDIEEQLGDSHAKTAFSQVTVIGAAPVDISMRLREIVKAAIHPETSHPNRPMCKQIPVLCNEITFRAGLRSHDTTRTGQPNALLEHVTHRLRGVPGCIEAVTEYERRSQPEMRLRER